MTGERTGCRLSATLTPPCAPGSDRSDARTAFERSQLKKEARERAGHGGGIPGDAERSELVRALGAELRTVRAEAGMTQRILARRSGVSRRALESLEAGRRRPSSAMLSALAAGSTMRIPPGPRTDPAPITERLVLAAGSSLVVDTPGGIRRRQRRLRDARSAYNREVEAWWQGEVAAAQSAEVAFVMAMSILDRPGAPDSTPALEESNRHLDVFSRWMDQKRPGPWGTTSVFFKYARSQGYPVRRKGRRA